MTQPVDRYYSKEHEWVLLEGDTALVGITDYAQDSLGDIVYVELPRVGMQVKQFGEVGVVESVKAVSDLFSPIGGEVVEVNPSLEQDPALLNREPFSGGWLFKVKPADPAQLQALLGPKEYEALITAGT